MMNEPTIIVSLDLGDGRPPIVCNSYQEAEFFASLWRAFQGDIESLMTLRALPLGRGLHRVVADKTGPQQSRGSW